MDFYVKKIKSKEGINSLDLEKIKKEIPVGFKVADSTPTVTFTANHFVVSFKLQAIPQKAVASKSKGKSKATGK